MLGKPYNLIYAVGYNRYHYLDLDNMPYGFLGVTTVEQLESHAKRFIFKPKTKLVEVPVAHKMLPLNTLVMYTLIHAKMLNVVTYELDVEEKKIDIYNVWDEYDIEDFRKSFKANVLDKAGISNYILPYTIHNSVAKGFDKNGYSFLGVENSGSLNRTYWLVRVNMYGSISFVMVNETGPEKDSLTTSVNIVMLDRTLMNMVIEDFKNKKLKKLKESEEEIIDLTNVDTKDDVKLN